MGFGKHSWRERLYRWLRWMNNPMSAPLPWVDKHEEAQIMPRTHTVYWYEDSVAPLLEEIAKLRVDLDGRRPYLDAAAAAAMDTRLVLLEQAASLLTDWAD